MWPLRRRFVVVVTETGATVVVVVAAVVTSVEPSFIVSLAYCLPVIMNCWSVEYFCGPRDLAPFTSIKLPWLSVPCEKQLLPAVVIILQKSIAEVVWAKWVYTWPSSIRLVPNYPWYLSLFFATIFSVQWRTINDTCSSVLPVLLTSFIVALLAYAG
jgi:hypothetical protein